MTDLDVCESAPQRRPRALEREAAARPSIAGAFATLA
jgi:hypothetical protein